MPNTPRTRIINPPDIHPPVSYSHVVEVLPGKVAYISGQVALDREGKIVGEGNIVAQTRQVFDNLAAALKALGVGFEAVIKFNYYAVDASRLPEIRELRNEFVGKEHPPASTFVIIKALVRPEFLIEIEAVVALPG